MRKILNFETLKEQKRGSNRRGFCSIFFLSVLLIFYHLLSRFLKLWLLTTFPAAVFRNIQSCEDISSGAEGAGGYGSSHRINLGDGKQRLESLK